MKGFEYYLKLSSFWEYRRDNGMEMEAMFRPVQPDIAEDCPEEVVE